MFDDVFNDKQWKTAREKAGLKGGLTEKVSMGDEFKRFQQNKTVATAKVLKEKIALYEKQLKDKHSKEKYYTNLLKVVQGQKAAIETGIEAAERPVDSKPPVEKPPVKPRTDSEIKKIVDDVMGEVDKQRDEDARLYENTNNDPNVPQRYDARMAYMKLTKGFKALEEKFKSDRAAMTELLKKCQALETHPQLKTKPEVALNVAQKIVESLDKIENKSSELHMDFITDSNAVRKQEGGETAATKELDRLFALLTQERNPIADTNHACRVVLKRTLQSIGGQPKAQEILGRLGV